MSGLLTVAACVCPQTKGVCPHCTEDRFTSFSEWTRHIDRCHRAFINHGLQPSPTYGEPAKSIPQNASHQPTS